MTVKDGIKAIELAATVLLVASINDVLQRLKQEIDSMQTYKLFQNDSEKYISRDEVLKLIDEKIKERVK